MREWQVPLRIETGLRPSEKNQLNQPGCLWLQGMVATQYGLESPKLPVMKETTLEKAFPFPQVIQGSSYYFVVAKDGTVYENGIPIQWVDVTNWQPSQIGALSKTCHLIDFGKAYVLLNEKFAGWRMWKGSGTDEYLVKSYPAIKAGCAMNGRAFIGNFEPQALHDQWQMIFGGNSLGLGETPQIGKRMVWWSTIGGEDILWWLMPSLFIDGVVKSQRAHGLKKPLILDYLERNEAGFIQVSWPGEVLAIKPFYRGVLVAGTGGVSLLTPMQDGLSFGEIVLSNVGILSPTAIGGTLTQMFFIGADGYLYSIGEGIQRLGFREYFYPLRGATWCIQYEPFGSYYVFSNAAGSFILVADKLSYIGVPFSGFFHDETEQMMAAIDLGADYSLVVDSNVFDFGYREIKNIVSVHVAYSGSERLRVAVAYRMRYGDAFRLSEYRPVNDEGVVHIPCAGVEFFIRLTAKDFRKIEQISSLSVTFSATAKRWIRGTYADTADKATSS